MEKATVSSIIPNAIPRANSPLPVSKAMAVVIFLVNPLIFPPNIIDTPTSAKTRPKPAIIAAKMANFPSARMKKAVCKSLAPNVRAVFSTLLSIP